MRKKSSFKRQLRNRTRVLTILCIMILIPIFKIAKESLGFDSSQEFIEEIAIWLIRLTVIGSIGFLGHKIVNTIVGRPTGKVREPSGIRKVIEYWYQSVLDGKLATITERDLTDANFVISIDEFRAGQISRELPNILNNNRSIEVLIAPLRFQPNRAVRSGWKETVIPLWIPVNISPSGKLTPPERETFPWMPRRYLEPSVGDSQITVGEVKDLENFVFPENFKESWTNYLNVCERLFKSVTDSKATEFTLEGYSKDSDVIMFLGSDIISGSLYIESFYEKLISREKNLGLLQSLAKLEPVAKKKPSSRSYGSKLHLAQFQNKFPLSESQRTAVNESLLLPRGEILAVTGPPGTGKTTIIQSMIGSPWVEAAIKGRALPPVTLCCSSSNQATINILRAFQEAASDRWLPSINTFGLFCSSKSKAESLTDTLFTLVSGEGNLSEFENRKFVKVATNHFLERYSSQYTRTNKIEVAIKQIRSDLVKEFYSYQRELKKTDSENSLQKLDTTNRFRILRLASHYWEGRWLTEVEKLISAKEHAAEKRRNYLTKSEWQIRSMLTPCFVSTFAMAPEFFGNYYTSSGAVVPIDLLIADEAGQVSPEIAAPTFALAVKAAVIGDTAQLEPVWSVFPANDHGNLIKFKLLKPNDISALRQLEQSGALASGGDLMSRALAVSKIEESEHSGIFLSEHRRSVPQIVDFANRLSYDGRLKPMRDDVTNRLFPAFGYRSVQGQCEMSARSRKNVFEAKEIAKWLATNHEQISNHYKKDISAAVAVITPFTAQTKLLKELLSKQFPKMTIGTVHSLQGAEREIIIFSPAYDRNIKSEYIFDIGANMLNVAITRAKDSFIVIGDAAIFVEGKKSPSGILAKYLFELPGNKI